MTFHLHAQEDALQHFIQKYQQNVIGNLNGFDRLVIRGTLRSLAVLSGMLDFLHRMGVLFKDFGAFVEQKTQDLKQAMMQELLTGKTRLVPVGGAHA